MKIGCEAVVYIALPFGEVKLNFARWCNLHTAAFFHPVGAYETKMNKDIH